MLRDEGRNEKKENQIGSALPDVMRLRVAWAVIGPCQLTKVG
jgi:hypothetical protein